MIPGKYTCGLWGLLPASRKIYDDTAHCCCISLVLFPHANTNCSFWHPFHPAAVWLPEPPCQGGKIQGLPPPALSHGPFFHGNSNIQLPQLLQEPLTCKATPLWCPCLQGSSHLCRLVSLCLHCIHHLVTYILRHDIWAWKCFKADIGWWSHHLEKLLKIIKLH